MGEFFKGATQTPNKENENDYEELTEEEIREFDKRYSEILKSKSIGEISCFGNINEILDSLDGPEFEKPVVDIGVPKFRNKDEKI